MPTRSGAEELGEERGGADTLQNHTSLPWQRPSRPRGGLGTLDHAVSLGRDDGHAFAREHALVVACTARRWALVRSSRSRAVRAGSRNVLVRGRSGNALGEVVFNQHRGAIRPAVRPEEPTRGLDVTFLKRLDRLFDPYRGDAAELTAGVRICTDGALRCATTAFSEESGRAHSAAAFSSNVQHFPSRRSRVRDSCPAQRLSQPAPTSPVIFSMPARIRSTPRSPPRTLLTEYPTPTASSI